MSETGSDTSNGFVVGVNIVNRIGKLFENIENSMKIVPTSEENERDMDVESRCLVDLLRNNVNDIINQFGVKGIYLNEDSPCFKALVETIHSIICHGLEPNSGHLIFGRSNLWQLLSSALSVSQDPVCINSIESVEIIAENRSSRDKIVLWIGISLMNHSIGEGISSFNRYYGENMVKYYRRGSCILSDHLNSIVNILDQLGEVCFDVYIGSTHMITESSESIRPVKNDCQDENMVDLLQKQLNIIEKAQMVTIQQNAYYHEENTTLRYLNDNLRKEVKILEFKYETAKKRLERVESQLSETENVKESYKNQILEYKKILIEQTDRRE
jgi:hypothetical protein